MRYGYKEHNMTIYRFQTRSGDGAYRNDTNHGGNYDDRGDFDGNHPSPYNDRMLCLKWTERSSNYWKFGFKDMKQVNKWFTKKDQEKMAHFGIYLFKIEIKSKYVLVGSKQIAYRADKVLSCQPVYKGV